MKTRLFGLMLLVSFTVLVTGEYNSYGRQPSSSSFGAVYNDTHESRSAKRYINNDNPIPGDLLDNLVVDGFNRPVNIEFAPDGRIFVAEKAGVIKIVNADGTVQAEPWIDISRKVHDAADRGMLGMVLDPNFAVNKWVYVLYVRNPQEGVPNINANVASIGVIARYYDTPNGRADVGSEQILLGDGLNNGFPCCSNSHLVGDLAFGLDGTLFASAGDGARWEWVDDGSNRTPEDATCEQLFPNDDIGAFRAQSLDSLGGKIIRINKENGNGIGPENGLVANPMYDAANPKSIRSRIWVWGLRNPYRIHVRKDSNVGPGSIYISDVGFYDWEEFNLVREPGVNFGWPCVVADEIVDPEYNNAVANPIAAARCREILQLPRKSPLIYYNHWTPDWAGFTGNSPVGTAIYYGDSYPDRYTGDSTDRAVFCADFGYERWIRVFWVDENDNFKPEKGIQYLAGGIGPIVGLKSNPFTGDIYYWLLGGQIRRFVPADRPVINTPPRVYLAANPSSGNVALNGPLTVSFSSYGTFDQERNKFTMLWDFGDGSTSYEANPTHVYTTSGEFTVTLSVTDDEGLVGTKTMIVRTNNIAPTVRITSPVDNFVFPTETGTRTPFRATVTDPDTPGTGLNYRWEFRVVHNNHFHMDEFVTFDREFDFDLAVGVSALERNMLEIFLVVTDEAGNTAQDMIRVRPAGMTNGGPTAVLAVTPLTGDVLHNIALDATGSIDPDQDMLHIIWDFGDGSVISTYADMRTFYTYSRPGTYQVKVTVVDVFAVESESAPITVTVTGEPVPTSTGPLTTGPATTGPATTGAATTGPDTTGPATTTPDTSAPGSTGAETTASVTSGPDTTSGGNTGVTTTAPGTTSDPASTSNPSETTTASSTTESASTEGPVTTGSEITTGEEPNETTVGTTDKEPEVTTTSNSNNRQSSASSITMSFVVISISLIFVALL